MTFLNTTTKIFIFIRTQNFRWQQQESPALTEWFTRFFMQISPSFFDCTSFLLTYLFSPSFSSCCFWLVWGKLEESSYANFFGNYCLLFLLFLVTQLDQWVLFCSVFRKHWSAFMTFRSFNLIFLVDFYEFNRCWILLAFTFNAFD
jgi:hypothetical protein